MEVYEAVETLLATRDYQERPVPDDVVRRILEAGRLTGSSRNRQAWDFILIEEREQIERLGELARTGRYIAGAALAIAVLIPDRPIGYADGARATQDMMLAGWGAGVGSNWVGNVNTTEIREMLNVPQDRIVLNVIPFGYPTRRIGHSVQKARKPFSEVVHRGAYGQPYE